MKKIEIRKLHLTAETIANMRLANVRGGYPTSLRSANYCDSGVPYDCPSAVGGCTFTADTTLGGTATALCQRA